MMMIQTTVFFITAPFGFLRLPYSIRFVDDCKVTREILAYRELQLVAHTTFYEGNDTPSDQE
jgi:hypothetical protein